MKFVLFYHSLVSDWNHGNAHFLRGVASELLSRGHDVIVFEPQDSWSRKNLRADYGDEPIQRFHAAYPGLTSHFYDLATLDERSVLDGADVVIVHEWNKPELVRRIGQHHSEHGHYVLLFHDTHHRMVTEPDAMRAYELAHYDGVLAFGEVIRRLYIETGLASRAWTWHEAADTRLFRPIADTIASSDLIWIGNWGDNERTAELSEFLIEPVARLRLRARIHGVRYPETALEALKNTAIEYAGWLPNFEVPRAFSHFTATVHVPRQPYVKALPGIPTIRVFEALACGIPLISAPWDDVEGLFTPGKDFLQARDGAEMIELLRTLLNEPALANALSAHGLRTILARHTCTHRINELLGIVAEIEPEIVKAA